MFRSNAHEDAFMLIEMLLKFSEVADLLNITPERLSEIVQDLTDDGLLSVEESDKFKESDNPDNEKNSQTGTTK